MTENKTYEIKKTITCTNLMQLIDLNGTRKNFQSEFVVQSVKPNQPFNACVITQDQLDNGELQFETCNNGKFARRVSYQNNKHLNHYIAIKSSDSGETECSVVVRLTELPELSPVEVKSEDAPEVTRRDERKQDEKDFEIPQQARQVLKNELTALSVDPSYTEMRDNPEPTNASIGIAENDDIIIPGLRQETGLKWKWNLWTMIGVGCLILAIILWWRRNKNKSSEQKSVELI